MAPRVSVPVLSVASRVTEPSVSTAGSERTTAPRRLIREAPPASASVTTAGSESGTAATARATAATAVISHGWPRSRPETRNDQAGEDDPDRDLPPEPVQPALQGVSGDGPSCTSVATRPMALAAPGRDDDGLAGPTDDGAARVHHAVAIGQRPVRRRAAVGGRGPPAGTHPVSNDSSTCSRVLRSRRASAPTMSPAVDPEHVAAHQVPGGHPDVPARPEHPRAGRDQGRQGAHRPDRPPLLDDAQRGVDRDDQHDHGAVDEVAGHRGEDRGAEEHQDQRVGELGPDRAQQRHAAGVPATSLGPSAASRAAAVPSSRPVRGSTSSAAATSAPGATTAPVRPRPPQGSRVFGPPRQPPDPGATASSPAGAGPARRGPCSPPGSPPAG